MIGEDPYTLGLFDTAGPSSSISLPILSILTTHHQAKRITTACVHSHTLRPMSS
jgi:hypothetical protein